MTRVDKSPEQLNAEAQGPIEDRDLDAAIAAHRLAYKHDLWIARLHQRDGEPSDERKALKMKVVAKDGRKCSLDQGGWTGQPFSHPFGAFLDQRYGGFPWSNGFAYATRICRRTHSNHWDRPPWRGSLCHQLVSWVIRWDASIDYARLQLGLDDEAMTRRQLDNALRTIENRLDNLRLEEERRRDHPARTPAEWMAPEYQHHPLNGMHRDDCPQCLRNAA